MDSNTGLQRVELRRLTPEINNALIVGIIIAKQRPRKFNDVRNGESGSERAVWNFTLRDSPLCYINATCWGPKDLIFSMNDMFHVGDVVDILQPLIEIRKVSDLGENFRPRVTSPYTLTLNESSLLKMVRHEGNCDAYTDILRFTTKPIAGAVTIADIHNRRGTKIDAVDLLGIVRLVGKVRTVTTREGVEQQVREIVILDQTSPALRITIWEPDWIVRAGTWKICNTVLFLTDMRCQWSDFARSMVATLTSRTVVTENPAALEADNLRKYITQVPLQPCTILDQVACSVPNPETIQNVMNIQQVLDKIQMITNSTNMGIEEQQFSALLYVVVTQLDLDGLFRLIITKCSGCDTLIVAPLTKCDNAECPVALGQEFSEPVTTFDLRLMLSDQTGSLVNCRLSGRTAETVLNCTAQEFLAMSDEAKSILKWNLLMERCAVRIHIMCTRIRPMITIVSCTLAAPLEVANRLPHY